MIQELLIKGDHDQLKPKLPTNAAPLDGSPSSSSPSSTSAAAESLRCPRCDSSNTKFCYYNNYNLTQPRHFCKTCRRYWTKGGALRNVPIGGGCRKNKSASIGAALGKSSPGKLKTLSSEMAPTGHFTGFETAHHHHTLASNPNLLWGPPHNNNNNNSSNSSSSNHFLSLLRANQNPNHNYPNHHHHQGSDSFRVSGLDPTLGPSSLFRNQTGQGLTHGGGEVQYNGLQDLYQRLRSSPSTGCYLPAENAPLIGNITSANYSSLANAAILETAPVRTSGELGFWSANMNLSLPGHDVPTAANGAYPS